MSEKWKKCEYVYDGLWKPICRRYKEIHYCKRNECKFVNKIIIIGDIWEQYVQYTPIEIFEQAITLSINKGFIVQTNNPQFIEALEVLCGEKDIDIYIQLKNKEKKKISFLTAYDYLGDVYDIIDEIRGKNIAQQKNSFERNYPNEQWLKKKIEEYKNKHGEIINE